MTDKRDGMTDKTGEEKIAMEIRKLSHKFKEFNQSNRKKRT